MSIHHSTSTDPVALLNKDIIGRNYVVQYNGTNDVPTRILPDHPATALTFTDFGAFSSGKIELSAFNTSAPSTPSDFSTYQTLTLDVDRLTLKNSSNQTVFYVQGTGYGGQTTSTNPKTYFKHRVFIGTEFPNPFPSTSQLIADMMLAVNGAIYAKEFLIKSSWSDFVFDDDYKLMPLGELDSFIKTNRHLPDIPTAATVEKEGVKLGEINAKLLQKIEEMTLYIIQLEKRMSNLEKNK
jgi:hypothetical protein